MTHISSVGLWAYRSIAACSDVTRPEWSQPVNACTSNTEWLIQDYHMSNNIHKVLDSENTRQQANKAEVLPMTSAIQDHSTKNSILLI